MQCLKESGEEGSDDPDDETQNNLVNATLKTIKSIRERGILGYARKYIQGFTPTFSATGDGNTLSVLAAAEDVAHGAQHGLVGASAVGRGGEHCLRRLGG